MDNRAVVLETRSKQWDNHGQGFFSFELRWGGGLTFWERQIPWYLLGGTIYSPVVTTKSLSRQSASQYSISTKYSKRVAAGPVRPAYSLLDYVTLAVESDSL